MVAGAAGAGAPAAVDQDIQEEEPVEIDDEDDEDDEEDDDVAAEEEEIELDPDPDDDEEQAAYVTFEAQTTDGETVVVDEVTMANGGFVVIHDSTLLIDDVFGSVIGSSEYLEPGTHENVEIALDEPLEADEELFAMPHRDTNDNQQLDFVETDGQEDIPYLTADGEPVTDRATVTVEDEPVDEEPVDDEPVDEEPVDDEPVDEEPVDELPDDVAIDVVIEQATVFTYIDGVDEMPIEDENDLNDDEVNDDEVNDDEMDDDEMDDDEVDDIDENGLEDVEFDGQIDVSIEQATVTQLGDHLEEEPEEVDDEDEPNDVDNDDELEDDEPNDVDEHEPLTEITIGDATV
ncbi:hypothetical protein C446_09048, partial [Halobiforma nitratireducens JCM 10879]